MQYRQFGSTDLMVSVIGFGGARLGGIFGDLTRPGMLQTLHRAFDEGINFYDTSDMYCQGESEKLLGEAFRDRRDKVIIASKAGYVLPRQRRLMAKVKPLLRPVLRRLHIKRENLPKSVRGELSQDFSTPYILNAVEQSLKRLKTDYLDLYQLHSPPAAVLEDGEVFETLAKLKRQGKIRHYGVSCETTSDALICLRYSGLTSLQLRINLLEQSALELAVPQAAAKGLAVIARECYAGGLLAKPPVNLEHAGDGEGLHPGLQAQVEDAQRHNRTLKQHALYFVLENSAISTALLGMNTEKQLASNLEVLQGNSLIR